MIPSKIKTAFQLTSDPKSYPRLKRIVLSRLTGKEIYLESTRDASERQCEKLAVSTQNALEALEIPCIDPKSRHGDIIELGKQQVAECPQNMGGAANLTLLYSIVLGMLATRVIETGVAYGWSSLAILLALRDQGTDGHLHSTNLHYSRYEGDERFVGCAVPPSLRNQWNIHRSADETAITAILQAMPTCDLIHYDSAKSYAARMTSYPRLWNALKMNGVFISDDISDNVAFFHFCKTVSSTPVVVKTHQSNGVTKYVGLIRKASDAPPRELLF